MKKILICSILLFLSVLEIVGAGYFYFDSKSFLEEAIQTDGTVIELIEKKSSDGDTMFAPVFIYEDKKGTEHKIYSSSSSYPPAYQVNEKVEVFYLEKEPSEAKINGFFELWGAATIFAGMSIMTFIMSVIFLLFMKPQQR